MIKEKTGLAGLLQRVADVARLVRPAPDRPVPPYVKCAACGQAGRDDQQVPDPAQFVNKPGQSGDVVGSAATVPAEAPDPIDVNWDAFNVDPGAAAERLSQARAKREQDGTDVRLIDAAPVYCAAPGCRAWFHAIGCYSLHRHDR
jgi:hypothetical protein